MYRFARVALAALVATVMFGCASTQKHAIKNDARKMLMKKQNVVLSGKTGEVVGTPAHAELMKTYKTGAAYPDDSLRVVLIEEMGEEMDPKTLEALKGHKDLVIDGETGEIQGLPASSKDVGKAICPVCGFPVGSFRQQALTRKNLMTESPN